MKHIHLNRTIGALATAALLLIFSLSFSLFHQLVNFLFNYQGLASHQYR